MPVASATSLDARAGAQRLLDLVEPAVGRHRGRGQAARPTVSAVGPGAVQNPAAFVSIERSALPSASVKLRPIDIASPTLFMCVVSTGSAPGNFSKANRGTLTTT